MTLPAPIENFTEALPEPAPQWTPQTRANFLRALARCGNVRSSASYVQMSREGAYQLRRRDADFAATWDAALLCARDLAEDALQDRAISGVEELVFYHGEEVATRRRYDARLLLALLTRLDRLEDNPRAKRGAAHFDEMVDAIEQGPSGQGAARALISEPLPSEVDDALGDAALGAAIAAERERRDKRAHEARVDAEITARREQFERDNMILCRVLYPEEIGNDAEEPFAHFMGLTEAEMEEIRQDGGSAEPVPEGDPAYRREIENEFDNETRRGEIVDLAVARMAGTHQREKSSRLCEDV